MSKILIWNKNLPLKNAGGPAGYLYNIHSYLKEHPVDEISFYSDVKGGDEYIVERGLKRKIKDIIAGCLGCLLNVKHLFSQLTRNNELSNDEIEMLKTFDFVHFHTFIDARLYLKSIRKKVPNIRVILTTHTPEPYCDEYCGTFGISWILKIPGMRNKCIRQETQCINDVDYLMFPVPQVKEVYVSNSSLYEKALKEADYKTFYVPTAIIDVVNSNNEGYLENKIKDDSLRVCYVGRHCAVKGYDFLKAIANEAFSINLDVTFIIGGSQNGIPKLDDDRWIELGWVNTVNLLREIDVFVLPNQQTYYDLILLEVIRSGKPVLLTSTGGNKYFKKYQSPGMFYCDYGNVKQACEQLKKLINYKKQGGLSALGKENRNLFEKTSTLPVYVERYLAEISKFS